MLVGDDNDFFGDDDGAVVDDGGAIFVGVDGKVGETSPSPEDSAFIVELIAVVMRSFFGISLVVEIFVTVVLQVLLLLIVFLILQDDEDDDDDDDGGIESMFVATKAKGGNCVTGSTVRKLPCESASNNLSITVSIDNPILIAKTKGIGPCCFILLVVVLSSDGNGKSAVNCK